MRWLGAVTALAWTMACSAGEDTEVSPQPARDAGPRADVAAADVVRGADSAADVVTARDVATAPDTAPPQDVGAPDAEDLTPDETPDGGTAAVDVEVPHPTMGMTMRVTASSLNLRSGPGTTNAIITSMACGTQVTVIGGPTSGWWNIRTTTAMGWASGAYLVAESAFSPSVCGTTPPPTMPPPASMSGEVDRMFELARPAVNYSYYWGHGSWRDDGAEHGSCSGSCPSCSHSGRYGADCSGFVAKCWQVPGASPITTDAHPYSTYNFYNQTTHWSRAPRTALHRGDALVYNTSGHGHIVLYESGTDPWGSLWVYEARGCSYGILHSNRSFGTDYVGIRREGL